MILKLIDWILAHHAQVMASLGLLATLCRAIPAAQWAQIEAQWPRVANAVRFLRAIAPDGAKAARAAWAIWTGKPWR